MEAGAPNFETVTRVYEQSRDEGKLVESAGTLKIIVKGLIFYSDDGSRVWIKETRDCHESYRCRQYKRRTSACCSLAGTSPTKQSSWS